MNKEMFFTSFVMDENFSPRLELTLASEDDIGVVLRVHLITESMIELFCCAAVNNRNLLDGFGENITLTYAAKLKLAENLGLNEHSVAELKRINKIRNARSHQIENSEITDAEIASLRVLISRGGQEDFVNANDFGLHTVNSKKYLNRAESTNREKFLAILGAVIFRITTQVAHS